MFHLKVSQSSLCALPCKGAMMNVMNMVQQVNAWSSPCPTAERLTSGWDAGMLTYRDDHVQDMTAGRLIEKQRCSSKASEQLSTVLAASCLNKVQGPQVHHKQVTRVCKRIARELSGCYSMRVYSTCQGIRSCTEICSCLGCTLAWHALQKHACLTDSAKRESQASG